MVTDGNTILAESLKKQVRLYLLITIMFVVFHFKLIALNIRSKCTMKRLYICVLNDYSFVNQKTKEQ